MRYPIFEQRGARNFATMATWRNDFSSLIHDTHNRCTRLRIDGIKAMSRGFLGGKQVI